MRYLWLALVLSALPPSVYSQIIDEEVMAHVVEPCLIHAAELNGMTNVLPLAEALKVLKASNLEHIQIAVSGTIEALRNNPLPANYRTWVYDETLKSCKEQNLMQRDMSGGHHLREDMKQYEMDCYQDINCWWDTAFKLHVGWMCEDAIHLKTRGNYAWMSIYPEDKWSSITWGDNQKKTVKLIGNYLRTPDIDGQYTQKTYTCIYDRDTDLVSQVSIH